MKFSVQTAVLPELTREQVVAALRRHGYDGVEWRLHEEYHVKPSELREKASDIRRLVRDHGLDVSCLMGYAPLADVGLQERIAEACAVMECPRYRPGAVLYDGTRSYRDLHDETVDRLGKVIEAVAPYRVKPVIETHFGTVAPSASLAYRLVQHFDPAHVGINYDPANLVIEGHEAWQLGLELIGPYLDYVHAKNVSWVRENGVWRWRFEAMDRGQVDWREVARVLKKVGYDGWISFENFYKVPMRSRGYVGEDLTQEATASRDIDDRLAEDVAFMRACLAG
ncbi:MAG: sugar phosphate isomerase/epimerase [Candidatus Rokubacteria bacterium]|nr:sugar phosphate isomerase/epimerase [Candidatus Rokubacteria bacterium]